MKVCLQCEATFASLGWRCPSCGVRPHRRDGYLFLVPEGPDPAGDFNRETFGTLARIEEEHFWFRARSALVVDALREFFSDARTLLEVGCGSGIVLRDVSRALPGLALSGGDRAIEGLRTAARRVPQAALYCLDAKAIPFRGEFDVVAAFDVLEHLEDDAGALEQMAAACRPSGGILLTVPQHPLLWSRTDEYACHKRRYRRGELVAKVEAAGLSVEYVSSFVSLLLPFMALSRIVQRIAPARGDGIDGGFRIGRPLNGFFGQVMALERILMRNRRSLPVGGSLLVVARKPGTSSR